TDVAGIAPVLPPAEQCIGHPYPQSQVGAWLDLDGDGWLDLYVPNYNCNPDNVHITDFKDQVWRNNHDGTFADWTATHGFGAGHGSRSALPLDVDGDGDVDLFVPDY